MVITNTSDTFERYRDIYPEVMALVKFPYTLDK